MSGTPTVTHDSGDPSIDRRWFEEALRAQGFIVEPPPDDAPHDSEPSPGEPSPGEPSPGEPSPGEPSPGERPPVPGALLARIASQSQLSPLPRSAPDATSAVVEPEDTVTPHRTGPAGAAVVTTVAPWSSTTLGAPRTDTAPVAPEPGAIAGFEAASVLPSEPAVVPEPAVPHPTGPGSTELPAPARAAGTSSDASRDDEQGASSKPERPMVATAAAPGRPAGPVGAAISAQALVAAPSAPPRAEGEVRPAGSSERGAAETSPSEIVRVALTILTALVILVVVVGAIIVASQVA